MGRLIPAGTGLRKYKDYQIQVDELQEEEIEGVIHDELFASQEVAG